MCLYHKKIFAIKILLHIDNLCQRLAIFAKPDFFNLLDRYYYSAQFATNLIQIKASEICLKCDLLVSNSIKMKTRKTH